MTKFTEKDAKLFLAKIGIDISKEKFTIKDLVIGFGIELEHGRVNKRTNVTNDDLMMTGKIALAHLNEDPQYYEKLEKYVEKPAERKQSRAKSRRKSSKAKRKSSKAKRKSRKQSRAKSRKSKSKKHSKGKHSKRRN